MGATGADVPLPVLEYLQRGLAGELSGREQTHLRYPTAISQLLGMTVVQIDVQTAAVQMAVQPLVHGNQQGTVHGGTIAELVDAAIGTAHSTVIGAGESFATIELSVRYLRPVWETILTASAAVVHAGRTIAHYRCEVHDDPGRLVAVAESSVMTLRGVDGDRSKPRDAAS